MKPILLTSAVSLTIGFAGGWMIKSASHELESVSKNQPLPIERPKPTRPSNPDPDQPFPTRPDERPDDNGITIDFPEAEIPESALQTDRAKWMRLTEVLGLDADQSKAIAANIEESRPKPSEDESPDIIYGKAGEDLEKRILAILTPEQQAEFKKFQQRAIENIVEQKAQRTFSEDLGNLDLTPAQREQALEVFRQRAEADVSEVSPATRLTLAGSILPIGNEKFSDESILLLRKIGTNPSMEDMAAIHRAEIEERMKRFQDVLTPGQMESYRASLGESLENLDIISPPK